MPAITYSLSISGGYVESLSFYAEAEADLVIKNAGNWAIKEGFNAIPVNVYTPQLELTASARLFVKDLKLTGLSSTPSGSGCDLYSAIYPTSSALFSSWLVLPPTSPTEAVLLKGADNVRVKAFYCPDWPKHNHKSNLLFTALSSYPLPPDFASLSLSYSGALRVNGVDLPPSLQGSAALEITGGEAAEGVVTIGSQTVPVNISIGQALSISGAGSVEALTVYRSGDSEPFMSFDTRLGQFRCGFAPEDFESQTFLPLTGWQSVFSILSLPFPLYGGVLRLDFTDLPAGLATTQQQLVFQAFERKAEPVRNVVQISAARDKSINLVPTVLKTAPGKKTTDIPPAAPSHTPFFSPSAGLVLSSGAAFEPSEIASLASQSRQQADTDGPVNSAGGFTRSTWLSSLGYSLAVENVLLGSNGFPIQGQTAFIDPSFFNGKTVTFSKPFSSISLAPSSPAPAGFEKRTPCLLNKTPSPENVYQVTPDLDAFWADSAASWESSNKTWGMDNPNLSFNFAPDLKAPYAAFSTQKQTAVPLGVITPSAAPLGFEISFTLAPGSSASLLLGDRTLPLSPSGSLTTSRLLPSRALNIGSVQAILKLTGSIKVYEACFIEGRFDLGVTGEAGFRCPINGLFYGQNVNLRYPTRSLTFDFTPLGDGVLPGGFTLQANTLPGWISQEAQEMPQYPFIVANLPHTAPPANSFFRVTLSGFDDEGNEYPIPPSACLWRIENNPDGAYSNWGGGWFFTSQAGAPGSGEVIYGGQSVTVNFN